jgi:hypothetical protein
MLAPVLLAQVLLRKRFQKLVAPPDALKLLLIRVDPRSAFHPALSFPHHPAG